MIVTWLLDEAELLVALDEAALLTALDETALLAWLLDERRSVESSCASVLLQPNSASALAMEIAINECFMILLFILKGGSFPLNVGNVCE